MKTIELLAVVEVPKTRKVLCQAKGCGHSVYRQVHVISQDKIIGVYGSVCAKKIFGTEIKNQSPSYSSGEGRTLSDEERDLLDKNTAALIEKLRIEHSESLISETPDNAIQPPKKIDAEDNSDSMPKKNGTQTGE